LLNMLVWSQEELQKKRNDPRMEHWIKSDWVVQDKEEEVMFVMGPLLYTLKKSFSSVG
jgi:hypothetical protein